jgi:hypothetical protein
MFPFVSTVMPPNLSIVPTAGNSIAQEPGDHAQTARAMLKSRSNAQEPGDHTQVPDRASYAQSRSNAQDHP